MDAARGGSSAGCYDRRAMCHRSALALTPLGIALCALASPAAWSHEQPASPCEVRYVANAGVLVRLGEARLLIDAPIRQGIPPYATSSPEERVRLERAAAPYDRVDAILITHWHEDHFSPEAVAAHLTGNTRAVLVSSPEVVERVRQVATHLPDARFRAVLPEPGASRLVMVGTLPVRVLRIRHNPARRPPEQHVGFLVGDNPAVLHTGDADPQADNFTVLRGLPRVRLALLPFWYVLNETNRRVVRESIAPDRIVAMHLPPQDADEVRRTLREAQVDATLLGSDLVLCKDVLWGGHR